MQDIELKELEGLLKLISKYQVESLELPSGLKITKKIHLGKALPKREAEEPTPVNLMTEEEIMFAATAAPRMNLEDFDRFAVNPPKE